MILEKILNLILTTKCDKSCNFCFAKNHLNKLKTKDMCLEDFSVLAHESKSIKLLGGEPTQSHNFVDYLEKLQSLNKNVTLITNLIFDNFILDVTNHYTHNNTINYILANASYLKDLDRIDTFKRNFKSLDSNIITAGLTIEKEKDEEYYKDYIEFLIKEINFKSLRISLDYGENNRRIDKYINDKKTGNSVYSVWNMAVSNDIEVNFDCNMYPCLFEPDRLEEIKQHKLTKDLTFVCDKPTVDIDPEMNAFYCFPLSNKVTIDLKKENANSLKDEVIQNKLIQEYNHLLRNSEQNINEHCENCNFYKKECEGPCLALL